MINVLLFEDFWDSNNQPVIDTISKTNSKKEHLISHFETILLLQNLKQGGLMIRRITGIH